MLYTGILALYGAAIIATSRARSLRQRWVTLWFVLAYVENVVAFPAGLAGLESRQWIVGLPETTQYLGMVFVAMLATAAAMSYFSWHGSIPGPLQRLRPLKWNHDTVFKVLLAFSAMSAVVSIVLSANGLEGYFINVKYLYEPPAWLGAIRYAESVGMALMFVLCLAKYLHGGKPGGAVRVLSALWCLAGIVSGFKTFVVLPFVFAATAAFVARRGRLRHWLYVGASIVLAYSVVEPLRVLRQEVHHDNAIEGVRTLAAEDRIARTDSRLVFTQLIERIDYSATAVEVLIADASGQVDGYKARLRETYMLMPALCFIPAAVWPSKPLADLGRVLSLEMGLQESQSITPSNVVASYLWLGWTGVVLNCVIGAYCVVLGGRLLDRVRAGILVYTPVVLLVLALSIQTSIMAYYYISLTRAFACVAVLYVVARLFGLLERPSLVLPTGCTPIADRSA
jgi:hypothetical protein